MNENIKIELCKSVLHVSFTDDVVKGFIEFTDNIRTYLTLNLETIRIDLSSEDSIDSLIVGKMIKIIKISRDFEKTIIFIISAQVEKIIKLTFAQDSIEDRKSFLEGRLFQRNLGFFE